MDEHTRAAFAQALALHRRGDLSVAEAAYRDIYARDAQPAIAQMIGTVLHQQRRSDESLAWFDRATAAPSAGLFVNHAAALLAVGSARAAEALSRRALTLVPTHAGAQLNLALALQAQQRDEAGALFAALIGDATVGPIARRGWLRSLLQAGQVPQALAAIGPAEAGEHAELGLLRAEAAALADRADADELLETAARRPETRVAALIARADRAQRRRDSTRALADLDLALEADPQHRGACIQIAMLHLQRGEVDACLARLRAWLERHPDDAAAHSLYLRSLQYAPDCDAAALLAAHRGWAERHAPRAETVAPHARRDGEPLRIGWLSPAFRNGPVQTFLLATLQELRAQNLSENILYNVNLRHEPSAAALRAVAHRWFDAAHDSDAELVERLRADELDVLVDLAGHAQGGRLTALARRVAPLQATWLDSFGTTGVPAIDIVLSDAVCSPPGSEGGYSEAVQRLAAGRLCYTPPVPWEASPADSRRFVCLNHYAKINDAVVDVWAEILCVLPDWTLHLQARGGDDADVVARLRAAFLRRGVDGARIECAGYGSLADAFAAYRAAAIALDPFAYCGGATSCDALWMGLPLVTWPRDTLVSRQSASLLHALGRTEWIASDAADYVAIACRLAADVDGRRAWRSAAPTAALAAFGDAPRFARSVTAALGVAWQRRADAGFPAQ